MAFPVLLFSLVSFLMLCLLGLWSLCWPHRGPAQSRAAAKMLTTIQRLLKPRSPLDSPACCHASTPSPVVRPAPAPVRPWHEVKRRRGVRHPHRHARLRLSQPTMPIPWGHRCSHPCSRRGWQTWAGRAHPDLSLSGLPHHVHCPTPHPVVSSENALSPHRHGLVRTGRRAGPIGSRADLRLPTSDHHAPF